MSNHHGGQQTHGPSGHSRLTKAQELLEQRKHSCREEEKNKNQKSFPTKDPIEKKIDPLPTKNFKNLFSAVVRKKQF